MSTPPDQTTAALIAEAEDGFRSFAYGPGAWMVRKLVTRLSALAVIPHTGSPGLHDPRFGPGGEPASYQSTATEKWAAFEKWAALTAAEGLLATPPTPREWTDADVERAARIIDPSSWRVFDGYLADVKRKYGNQDAAYDPAAFKDRASMEKARQILATLTPPPAGERNADLRRECARVIDAYADAAADPGLWRALTDKPVSPNAALELIAKALETPNDR